MKEYQKPLPLNELRSWVLPSVYEWLEQGDEEAAAFQAELDEAGTDMVTSLFGGDQNDSDDDDEDGEDTSVDSNRSDLDFEGLVGRVRVWSTSNSNVNGVGSSYKGVVMDTKSQQQQQEEEDSSSEESYDNLRIVYVISESWEGYGDLLWASSRHLANQFADPNKCRRLLEPLFKHRSPAKPSSSLTNNHPLAVHGIKVLELGAGCGVPSLVAMKCGAAKVVCTDLDNPNRIRCIAESMQRNFNELPESRAEELSQGVMACPFRWGESSGKVQESLNPNDSTDRFDVICATDCLFMPWLHYDLLQALEELLAKTGVAIFAFCIHEAFSKDHEVWPFVDKAEEKGFAVETLEAVQLTPPKPGMPSKQGLVNVLRLTRKA